MKTASLTFTRPFDVSSDRTLTITPGTEYAFWLIFGVWPTENNSFSGHSKGMTQESKGEFIRFDEIPPSESKFFA